MKKNWFSFIPKIWQILQYFFRALGQTFTIFIDPYYSIYNPLCHKQNFENYYKYVCEDNFFEPKKKMNTFYVFKKEE